MNQNFIGLDAHSLTSTFVSVNEKGVILDRCQVSTAEKNLLRYVRQQNGIKKLVLEETNLAQWLYLLLKDEVSELVVCNPLYIAKRKGPKNDYADALHLAQQLRGNHLTTVYHEDSFFMELRKMISGYDDLINDIVRVKNRYKALYRSQGLPAKGSKIYNEENQSSQLKINEGEFVAKHLMNQLSVLEENKEEYVDYFGSNMKKYSILRTLDSIPGFDKIRSNIVAALICSPHRFHDKHKLWAYSMLVRYNRDSDGQSYGSKKIYGCSMLKNVFMGAANDILRGNTSLKKYYDKEISSGVCPKHAKKNVARKIAAITLSVLKKDKKYDDHYEEKKERLNLKKQNDKS